MIIDVPEHIVEECKLAHFIQMTGSAGGIEDRCSDVERIQHHIGEIISALIIKEIVKHD